MYTFGCAAAGDEVSEDKLVRSMAARIRSNQCLRYHVHRSPNTMCVRSEEIWDAKEHKGSGGEIVMLE